MKTKHMKWILSGFLSMLCLTACGSGAYTVSSSLTSEIEPQELVGHVPDDGFLISQTAFARNLLMQTAASCENENILISPYSAMQALAMTANGADGSTRAEMEQALGGIPCDDLNQYLYSMRTGLMQTENAVLQTANSVWIRDQEDRISVKQDFLQTVKNGYDADAFKKPFDNTTCNEINGWVRHKTSGMIEELLDTIPQEAVMYLVNATAFDAKWSTQYDDAFDSTFTAADGSAQNCRMMYGTEHSYLSDDHATGFMKYYQDGGYAFCALLPEEGMTPQAYLEGVTAGELHKMLTEPAHEDVETGLPVFSYDFEMELSETLTGMGMKQAFLPDADFSKMADTATGSLYISRVLHKTHIDVDTEGTKAAAVTAVEMADGADVEEEEPKRVILDRPFVYMIVDTKTMIPIFTGILNEIPQ
ncbi:MAG TPA: hypothetical protein DCG49_05610 [Ruminococcus sp.]|nr:hypothetical protein [Ruminococcus sp.]